MQECRIRWLPDHHLTQNLLCHIITIEVEYGKSATEYCLRRCRGRDVPLVDQWRSHGSGDAPRARISSTVTIYRENREGCSRLEQRLRSRSSGGAETIWRGDDSRARRKPHQRDLLACGQDSEIPGGRVCQATTQLANLPMGASQMPSLLKCQTHMQNHWRSDF